MIDLISIIKDNNKKENNCIRNISCVVWNFKKYILNEHKEHPYSEKSFVDHTNCCPLGI